MSEKICCHIHTTKEVLGGIATTDRICNECGVLLTREELKAARDAMRAAMKISLPK